VIGHLPELGLFDLLHQFLAQILDIFIVSELFLNGLLELFLGDLKLLKNV
jgi:hypothetical protein